MLCLFIYSANVAQIELWPLLGFLGLVVGIVINAISLKQSIKKSKAEHDDKFVGKELLNEKLIGMNVQVLSISKEVDELKRDNQREHDEIKRDLLKRLDQIWNWIEKRG